MRRISFEAGCPARGQILALLFDPGCILFDATLGRRQLHRLARRFGIAGAYAEFFQTWDDEYLPQVYAGERDYAAALRAFLSGVGLGMGQIDELQAACGHDFSELEAGQRPLPGVKTTLRRLADAHLSLAVVTDSPHPGQQYAEQLERLGLRAYFTQVQTSRDFPAALQGSTGTTARMAATLAWLALPSRQVVLVSQQQRLLDEARRAGLWTASLGRGAELRADWPLESIEDLLDCVPGEVRRRIAC